MDFLELVAQVTLGELLQRLRFGMALRAPINGKSNTSTRGKAARGVRRKRPYDVDDTVAGLIEQLLRAADPVASTEIRPS